MNRLQLLRAYTLASPLSFTAYHFQENHHAPFVVGQHHQAIARALERVVKGDTRRLIINIAPRYGKTELAVKGFIAYGLALNPAARFLHISYSASLAMNNSTAVKDILQQDSFRELYPYTAIQRGRNTKGYWETTAGGGVYATTALGQVTGFGAGLVDTEAAATPGGFGGAIIIDDPIKPADALSDLVRERVNSRFESTIRTRVNSRRTPIVIIMQRLHEHDICGYLQQAEPSEWEVLSLPAINEQGEALWPFKHDLEELRKLEAVDPVTFQTQYMQNPTPQEGLLYNRDFQTYTPAALPPLHAKRYPRCCYVDTADTGADYLCAICYIETPEANYVTDVLFTAEPMEHTEPELAKLLRDTKTESCIIESNNGGRTFGRNVINLYNLYGGNRCQFSFYTQRENKFIRLYQHAAEVVNLTRFPADWQTRWPAFYSQIHYFRRQPTPGAHDDAPDALTGTIEHRGKARTTAADLQMLNDFL